MSEIHYLLKLICTFCIVQGLLNFAQPTAADMSTKKNLFIRICDDRDSIACIAVSYTHLDVYKRQV